VKALGSFDTILNVACLAGVIFYLWRYFSFLGYDLAEFRPAVLASGTAVPTVPERFGENSCF
jgi:hypothetical protein